MTNPKQEQKNSNNMKNANIHQTVPDKDVRIHEGFIYQQIPGDGHCLYNAVALYINEEQSALRSRVAAYIEHNLETFNHFIELAEGQSIKDYLNAVRVGVEWASHVEIEVLMRVLDRPIIIIGPDGKIRNRDDASRFQGDPIFTYYNDRDHYDVLLLSPAYENRGRQLLIQLLVQMIDTPAKHLSTQLNEHSLKNSQSNDTDSTSANSAHQENIRLEKQFVRRKSIEGVSESLSPAFRQYPLEQVTFSTLVLDEIRTNRNPQGNDLKNFGLEDSSKEGALPKDPAPLDLSELVSGGNDPDIYGFKQLEIAHRLTYQQSWYAEELALGRLIHTMPLAPGEMVHYAIVDWTHTETGSKVDKISESENLNSAASHARAISEISQAVGNQASSAFSTSMSNSVSHQNSGGGGFAILGIGGGFSSSSAESNSRATSFSIGNEHKDFASNMAQQITDATHQHASAVRSKHVSVIQEVNQAGQSSASTRVVGNFNKMHTLTLQYYQVVQIFKVKLDLVGVEKWYLVPFKPVTFTKEIIDAFWQSLSMVAYNRDVAHTLRVTYGKLGPINNQKCSIKCYTKFITRRYITKSN